MRNPAGRAAGWRRGNGRYGGKLPGRHPDRPRRPPIEQYAARELQRYLYQLSGGLPAIETAKQDTPLVGPAFLIGRAADHPLIARLIAEGTIKVSQGDPGAQGYVLKTLPANGKPALAIVGGDEVGCLYGVYGLLEDHYGMGFYLGGDVLPERKTTLGVVTVDERKTPAVAIRGFLPWTNFPQSATSYSWQDWRFIIDQMAKMRMNFLHIHNYNGDHEHNEMFHNFTLHGVTSRVWMPTARTGHRWSMPGWDVTKYRFGAGDLFDDYDYGADCALHNETLSNVEVFRKGASLFQKVIAYAHTRGVKIGLGVDMNLKMPDYKEAVDDPQLIAARVKQIAEDYPDLDYLLCFQSEGMGPDAFKVWQRIFDGFYKGMKARSPRTALAVAGWGLVPASIAKLPADVICGPISQYSDGCASGKEYGTREFWGCPWLERDFGSSEYYYPVNMHLFNTVKAWEERAANMNGFYCLSWRVTDAVEPKMSFLAKAPWDKAGRYATARAVYRDYAERNYGPAAAETIAAILDNNEPYVNDYGECCGTPQFFSPPMFKGKPTCDYLFNFLEFTLRRPEGAKTTSAAAFNNPRPIANMTCGDGKVCVTYIGPGTWLRYDNVDFGGGTSDFEAVVASPGDGGVIEIRLDGPDGTVLGKCNVGHSGDWQKWSTFKTTITKTAGKHALCLRMLSYPSSGEYHKAVAQLAVIDECMRTAPLPAYRARLAVLRCRIAAAKDHIELNRDFDGYAWKDLPGAMPSWVANFTHRVVDVSSLGNVVSTQNRYVQLNYETKEKQLRKGFSIQPPSGVTARGTHQGAVVAWKNEQPGAKGFHVYRGEARLTAEPLPPNAESYADTFDGAVRYAVTVVGPDGKESVRSEPAFCEAGSADKTPPHIVVVSPPVSVAEGQPVWIKARVLDNRAYDSVSARLHFRTPGAPQWQVVPMKRRVKAVFTVEIPAKQITAAGLEYYVEADDGDNLAIYPNAPLQLTNWTQTPLSLVVCPAQPHAPATPGDFRAEGDAIAWSSPAGEVFWYRIYRSQQADFQPGPDTFLTYVANGTTRFRDASEDFAGRKRQGAWYYRVTAVSKDDFESPPTGAVKD